MVIHLATNQDLNLVLVAIFTLDFMHFSSVASTITFLCLHLALVNSKDFQDSEQHLNFYFITGVLIIPSII